MAKIRTPLAAMALALLVASCGGGGGGGTPPIVPPNGGGGGSAQLTVGQIAGPDSITEGQSATYSVSASGVTGITYSWSVSPTSAGSFTNATSASAAFTANDVEADTAATIQVVVSASGQASQTRTKSITVQNVSAAELTVGQITGPSSVNEGQSASFSISASGVTGITYSWSVNHSIAGSLSNATASTVTFTASQVPIDTSVIIGVVVSAPNGLFEVRVKTITVENTGSGPGSGLAGDYSVNITRVGSNVYRVTSTDIYIETRYCYEYVYYEDAILRLVGPYSSSNELVFANGEAYPVRGIYVWYSSGDLLPGDYEVNISREAADTYRITSTDTYIRTRYCYEYVYSEDAILRWSGPYSFSNELIFPGEDSYTVVGLYAAIGSDPTHPDDIEG